MYVYVGLRMVYVVDCEAYVNIFIDVNVVSHCGQTELASCLCVCVSACRVPVCVYADIFEAYIIYVRRYAGNVSM